MFANDEPCNNNAVLIMRIDRYRYVFAEATHESHSERSNMGRKVH